METILVQQSDIDDLRRIGKEHAFTLRDFPKKHARKLRRIIRRKARQDRRDGKQVTPWDAAGTLFGFMLAMTTGRATTRKP